MSTESNQHLAQNLRQLMDGEGITESELAERTGVAQSTINRLLNCRVAAPKLSTIDALAGYFSKRASDITEKVHTESARIPAGASDIRVPLISTTTAGQWLSMDAARRQQSAEAWIPPPFAVGPEAFCIRARGDAMNGGGERSIRDGEVVFIDPARPAQHGSIVLAQLTGASEPTLRMLIDEGGGRFLEALNPNWPQRFLECGASTRIIGVAVGKVQPL